VHSYDPHGPVRRFSKPSDTAKVWNNDPSHAVHLPKYQRDAEITDPAFYREMYVRGVQYADVQVGRILDKLKAQGRYDDALVILLADHGESLTERPLWFDHGTSAHVEQLHIPLIIKYPKGKRAGQHDDRLVSLVDVAPTILETAKLPALPDPAGRALMHSGVIHTELTGESSHCKEVDILNCAPKGGLGKELAVRSLKQAAVYKSNGAQSMWESYNRTTDPAEIAPEVLGAGGPLREVLEVLHADRKARTYANPPGITAPPSAETEKLRSLGYVE
jgi:arylsulfatase A-like enzyme